MTTAIDRTNFGDVTNWTYALAAGVPNAPPSEDIRANSLALLLACDGLPAEIWGRESIVRALRHFRTWPSVAELYAWLTTQPEATATPQAVPDGMHAGPVVPTPWQDAHDEALRRASAPHRQAG